MSVYKVFIGPQYCAGTCTLMPSCGIKWLVVLVLELKVQWGKEE